MSNRGMAFAASRAERPLPVVENSGGGHDLNRYIPAEMRRVPGYTGHVPGRKIESSGIGMTYGNATSGLLNSGPDVNPANFTMPANPTDFRQTANKPIGSYVRPGDDPAQAYTSETQKVLARGAGHLQYHEREKKTIPGYMGFLPQTRAHIGGPGDQYWCVEQEGTMDGTASMSRTEYRDTTGKMPGDYDKPWLANTVAKGPPETLEKAWRPALEHGGQDPWHPGASTAPAKLANAELAMGPRTTEPQYPTHRTFTVQPSEVQYGRRAHSGHNMTHGGAASAALDAARIQRMNYKQTAHGQPGNSVTSLTTTGAH